MLTLRIFIMGLVALMPTTEQDGTTGLIVVVPQIEKHIPVIVFPTSDAGTYKKSTYDAACGLDIERNLRRDLLKGGFGAVRLHGQTISLAPLSEGTLSFADAKRSTVGDVFGAVPRTRFEAKDFSWVPRMTDLAGRSARMKSGYYEGASPLAAGVLHLAQPHGVKGLVETFHIAEIMEPEKGCNGKELIGGGGTASEASTGRAVASSTRATDSTTNANHDSGIAGDGFPFPFIRPLSFVRSGRPIGSPRQAVADEEMIELQVLSGDKVTLTLSDLKDPSKTQVIKVTPDPHSGVADIVIGNLTPLARLAKSADAGTLSRLDMPSESKCPANDQENWPDKSATGSCYIDVSHFYHYGEMADGKYFKTVRFGMDWRRVRAESINEEDPPVILTVRPDQSHGGAGRPLCTQVVFGAGQ